MQKLNNLISIYFSIKSQSIAFTFFTFFTCSFLLGQKNHKEGIVIYRISYQSNNPSILKDLELPYKAKLWFKKNHLRLESYHPYWGMVVLLYNSKSHQSIMLFNFNNKPYAISNINKSKKVTSKTKNFKINITYLKDSKDIKGIRCRKALINTTYNPNIIKHSSAFLVPNIPIVYQQPYPLKGLMLEFELLESDYTASYKAVYFKKKQLSSKLFEIPSNYNKLSMEDFLKLITSSQ